MFMIKVDILSTQLAKIIETSWLVGMVADIDRCHVLFSFMVLFKSYGFPLSSF